ncbi:MAG: hypothetical protein GXP29_14165, partial [Planctomycetes bacterium]|nr:hypothetical protein [Planctomycetota bacterium]
MAWMAVAEAAASLGVSERTIWRRIKSKAIEARGENGRTLVELSFGEDNNESVRQLSSVAAAQLSMRKLGADNVAEVLAVLSDYRASFDKQIAVTRRTARWLTALVFFLAVALGAGAWFHFEESSRLAGEHHDAIGEYRDDITEMQDSLAVAQSAHHKETAVLRGDIAVLKKKFGLAEDMSSAR